MHLRKILGFLLGALGAAGTAHPARKPEMVDVKSIGYTLATVAADPLEYVMPGKES
ncbi:hypothetical protein [Cupriavidus sp. CuC1]|uniref:hypothetical protein n=1 Tax=Cupriavidus sp. CuC1 TaxID=3373131 RepID=UPI0037CD9C14